MHPIPSDLKWIDSSWYKSEVLTPVRTALLRLNIVRTATDELRSILSPDGKKYIWFPSSERKEIRVKLWRCCSSWFPQQLPAKTDAEAWYDLIWDECGKLTTGKLAEFVESRGSLDALSKELSGKNVYEWLNEFYTLLRLDEADYDSIINKRRLFPNQNGVFCKKSELYRDAGGIDPVLKDILALLGSDLRAELLSSEVVADFDEVDERDQAYCPNAKLNEEHRMTLDEFLEKFEYLAQIINALDQVALTKYQLASFS